MTVFRTVGKVSRSCSGKYLRNCFFKHCRDFIIVKEEIAAHIFPIALFCPDSPFMIFGCVVHDKIHTYAHISFMAGVCHSSQILHGSQLRLYLPEICYCVSSV